MRHEPHAHGERAAGAGARTWLAAVGSFLVALVASSHHSLHMILLSLGLGATSFFMTPTLRRAMLLLSLAMAAFLTYRLVRHPERPMPQLVAAVVSICLSVGLVAYSVVSDGW